MDNNIEIDEHVEIEYDHTNRERLVQDPPKGSSGIKDNTTSLSNQESGKEKITGLKKSTVAGILLIIAFFLNIIFPILFIMTLQEVQSATGETILKGQIKDLDGEPVANVTVEIIDTEFIMLTNDNGSYRFDSVPVGTYEIQFTKPGYQTVMVKKTLFSREILDQGGVKENIIDIPGNLSSGLQIGSFEGVFNNTIEFNKTESIIVDRLNNEFSIIKGNLIDDIGKTIKNINITLYKIKSDNNENETEEFVSTQFVSELGKFMFENISIGIYILKINETGYSLLEIKNITIMSSIELELIDLPLDRLDETIVIEEDLFNEFTYTCIIILFILAFLTLFGGISALQAKRYSLAFIGAMSGILPVLLAFQFNLCGASIISLLAFVLIVFSRKEFTFKKRKRKDD